MRRQVCHVPLPEPVSHLHPDILPVLTLQWLEVVVVFPWLVLHPLVGREHQLVLPKSWPDSHGIINVAQAVGVGKINKMEVSVEAFLPDCVRPVNVQNAIKSLCAQDGIAQAFKAITKAFPALGHEVLEHREVHYITALSICRLEASKERHTSTRACAATKPQRKPSAFSVAAPMPLSSSMYSTSA